MSSPLKTHHVPQPIATVFGGTRIGNRPLFMPQNALEKFFNILAAHGITTIDTAQSYGNSEATIGQLKAGDRFVIDTKWSPPSFDEQDIGWAMKDKIINSAQESIQKLGVDQVDVFYLHRPDPLTPISETLSAVNDVYKRGLFRRFGLSGFPASEVEAIYNHCIERKGYPLPTVYQGSYNPFSRYKETKFLPTLRKLGISFYAYGPSAGGFLGKSVAQAEEMARNSNTAYISATCRPYVGNHRFLEALAMWNAVACSEGVSGAELAYRWVAYHSALERHNGDALIIGTSSPEQLEETLVGIEKGPLSHMACAGIDDIWENVKDDLKSPSIIEPYTCHQDYTVENLSFDPWVIYINNFIRDEEISHLLEISKNDWTPSVVFHRSEKGDEVSIGVDKDRLSSSVVIPHTDEVAKCLLKRTRSLLGNAQHESIESPQLIKYTGGEHFRPHLDTTDPEKAQRFHPDYPKRPWDQLLTALVYLGDDCIGGETYFPKVTGVGPDAEGDKFSRAANRSGLLVKPKKGNALIWKNLLLNGSVDDRLVHAGLAVKSGEKLAMNLFTSYYLDSPMIGGKATSA